jgi:DNA repair protein RadA/Sms
MSKPKVTYVCNACGAIYPKWTGQCSDCNAWNSLIEEVSIAGNKSTHPRVQGYAGEQASQITKLPDVTLEQQARWPTQLSELDRVLGGGLVPGSVVLLGGDPGIGKSTLLLQTLCHMSSEQHVLYVTGEESLAQVTLRARRLDLPAERLKLLTETCVERILTLIKQERPNLIVIDSIQTIYSELLPSAPGSVGQIRDSAAQLVQFAKQSGTAIFLVGHVTKEGHLAGPRVLEHMVDTVLYFEGEQHQRYRVLRAVKNRFGAVNELGVFAMTEKGLREVNNPSAIFLSRYQADIAGSVVLATWEGSRPLLVEVQALVDQSYLGNPRRITVGLEQNRLAMLLAVLHRHGGVATHDQDVFVNVVGGMRVTETAADLALQLSVLSSLRSRALPNHLIVFGEVGLAGEIRPVQNGHERLREAAKHGFKKAIVPKSNLGKAFTLPDMELIGVERLSEALEVVCG